MNTELQMLFGAILLGLVHIMVAGQLATKQRGVKWNLSSREGNVPELTGAAGRLDRASKNYRETFAFFAAAVLMVQVTGKSSSLSILGSQIYFYGRLLYLPIYGVGITGVRTAVWLISTIGLLMVLVSLIR